MAKANLHLDAASLTRRKCPARSLPFFIGGVMLYRTRVRIVIIVGIILAMDFMNFVADGHAGEVDAYESMVVDLGATVVARDSELASVREDYRDRLMEIVTTIYDREFYGMGGYETPQGTDVTEIYQAILNGVTDYGAMLSKVDNYFDARQEYFQEIPAIWPVQYSESVRITSGYGWRLSPITLEISFHPGIDVIGEGETEILATADGVVLENWLPPGWYFKNEVRTWFNGHRDFGGMIKIEHAGGFETVSGHLSKSYVHEGQEVKRGDPIGVMGNTGTSKGVHLHYEVRRYGELVNPFDYLQF
jgi:murein DD-endopeptidase MepM/ murein hydrolase activator NlpD